MLEEPLSFRPAISKNTQKIVERLLKKNESNNIDSSEHLFSDITKRNQDSMN